MVEHLPIKYKGQYSQKEEEDRKERREGGRRNSAIKKV
jgi:hypothetical protein